jgi:hypothetical protein
VLRDLLELAPYADVEASVRAMTLFAAASSRPDGAPWLFNDGGLDVAPNLALPAPPDGLATFAETGYVFLRSGGVALAFDCGPVSPPFLPAHAHADALSLQIWVDGEPVVIDPGMPTYDAGAERDFFRSSEAHSTVSPGGSQFESWGAFRAGPLPDVELLEARPDELVGRVVTARATEHVRRVRIAAGAILVEDDVTGVAPAAVVSTLVLGSRNTAIDAAVEPERVERVVAERFGERVPARALVQRGVATPRWRIALS